MSINGSDHDSGLIFQYDFLSGGWIRVGRITLFHFLLFGLTWCPYVVKWVTKGENLKIHTIFHPLYWAIVVAYQVNASQ